MLLGVQDGSDTENLVNKIEMQGIPKQLASPKQQCERCKDDKASLVFSECHPDLHACCFLGDMLTSIMPRTDVAMALTQLK